MKKSLLILSLLALFSVFANAQKFGYVDTKYILSHIPEYQSAQAEVNKLSSQWQKDIENKYATIEKLESAYQAEKILLTDEMRKKREEEIDRKKQEATQADQQDETDLKALENALKRRPKSWANRPASTQTFKPSCSRRAAGRGRR